MEDKRTLYSTREIAEATGLTAAVIRGRAKKLGLDTSKGGFTYEEVLKIRQRMPRQKKPDPRKIAELKRKLLNDGY